MRLYTYIILCEQHIARTHERLRTRFVNLREPLCVSVPYSTAILPSHPNGTASFSKLVETPSTIIPLSLLSLSLGSSFRCRQTLPPYFWPKAWVEKCTAI